MSRPSGDGRVRVWRRLRIFQYVDSRDVTSSRRGPAVSRLIVIVGSANLLRSNLYRSLSVSDDALLERKSNHLNPFVFRSNGTLRLDRPNGADAASCNEGPVTGRCLLRNSMRKIAAAFAPYSWNWSSL